VKDQEIADAAREIKAWLTAGDTSKAQQMCDQMLSLHADNKLFEGFKLEIENKEREVQLEFLRKLTSDLEALDFDARIGAIQQALTRYPGETQLSQLLKNATARRDLFNALIAEAHNEELSDRYDEALKRLHLLRELHPAMASLESEIHRIEALSESQKRMKHRASFVDAIFRLSSTGDYKGAVQQCVNALAVYPEDGGFLSLKRTVEEKAQHVTEIQDFVAEGLTFLRDHEVDAALESFSKAKVFDQSNLQVRYLISIALLEKARAVMDNDRRKLNALLDEAKNVMPNQAELQGVSFEVAERPADIWEESLIRIEHPAVAIPREVANLAAAPPALAIVPQTFSDDQAAGEIAIPEPEAALAPEPEPPAPIPDSKTGAFRTVAIAGVVLIGALLLGWFVFGDQSANAGAPAAASTANLEITATPEGVEIFVDGEKVGESQVEGQLTAGSHTVTARLAGYESQTIPLELGFDSKTLKIELQPTLLDLHIVSDQLESAVWMDGQSEGNISEGSLLISGIQPGVRILKLQTPGGETEVSFEFRPGSVPTLKSSPSPESTKVLFVGSAYGKSRAECNCATAGLRVGEFAELIQAGGMEVPLSAGQNRAELWLGRKKKNLTIQGSSSSPVATIAILSGNGPADGKDIRIESAAFDSSNQQP
jgi:tetratricopeptide (TPR) repeat protein